MKNLDYICKKHNLTKLEKEIVKFIVSNFTIETKLTIREVAENNFTSTSVIYKALKKIGFKSYMDFIFFLKNSKDSETEEKNAEFNPSLHNIIELLKARRDSLLMFSSTGISNNISNYLCERLAIYGVRAIANTHIQLLSKKNRERVLIIFISESGETDSLIDIAKYAAERKIESIGFFGTNLSTLEKLCTLSYFVEGVAKNEKSPNLFFGNLINTFEKLLLEI